MMISSDGTFQPSNKLAGRTVFVLPAQILAGVHAVWKSPYLTSVLSNSCVWEQAV